MARINGLLNNFNGGEISPKVHRRSDLEGYYRSTQHQKNFVSEPQGEMKFREGTSLQGTKPITTSGTDTRFVPFMFDNEDSYMMEFNRDISYPNIIRFYDNTGDMLLITSETIIGIEQRGLNLVAHINTGVPTDWVVNNTVHIKGLTTTNFTDKNYTSFYITAVNVSAFAGATHEILMATGTGVVPAVAANSEATLYAEYSIVHPFTAQELNDLQWVQKDDTMYITSGGSRQMQELVRAAGPPAGLSGPSVDFSIGNFATVDGTAAAIFTTAGNYPRAIAFHQGRLWVAGTNSELDTVWSSDIGTYNTFGYNTGTLTDDTGTKHRLAGNNDEIVGMVGTRDFLYIQTIGGGLYINGGSGDAKITYQNIMSKKIHNIGGRVDLAPMLIDESIFFVERSRRKLRMIDYSFQRDKFLPIDLTKQVDHFGEFKIDRVAFARGRVDRFYVSTQEGPGLVLTFDETTGTLAWSRYEIGSKGGENNLTYDDYQVFNDVIAIPGPSGAEDLVFFNSYRGGSTQTHIELRVTEENFYNREDIFSGVRGDDEKILEGDIYEHQIRGIYVDSAVTETATYGANLTLGSRLIGSTTATASSGIFASTDVGRRILAPRSDRYDGTRFGIAVVTAFNSSTSVDIDILEDFESTSLSATQYFFEWASIDLTVFGSANGGDTIAVIADGKDLGDFSVPSTCQVSINVPASVVVYGYRYKGLVKTTNLQGGGQIGPSDTKLKNIYKATVKFRNTSRCNLGSDIYNLEEVIFAHDDDDMNQPTPLRSEEIEVPFEEQWEQDKHIYIEAPGGTPCVIQEIVPYMNVSDD